MSSFVQIAINTIIAGGGYVLLSLGFNLLFKAVKFVDVSYGALFTISAYSMFYFSRILGINILLSAILSVSFTILIAILFNKFLYKPLRKKKTNNLIPLIGSLGVYTCVVAIISLVFSSQYKALAVGSSNVFSFLGGNFTSVHILTVLAAAILSVFLILTLYKTNYGRALRAVDDDKEVAEIIGIQVEGIITKAIILSSFVVSIAGILYGFDVGVVPAIGLIFFLKGVIASIVGGIGSIEGGIIGAIILAIAENLVVFFLSAQWATPVAFLVLIIILIIRPQGIIKRE